MIGGLFNIYIFDLELFLNKKRLYSILESISDVTEYVHRDKALPCKVFYNVRSGC